MKNVYFKIYEDEIHLEYDSEPILKGVVDVDEMFVKRINEIPLKYFDENMEKVLTVTQALDLSPLDSEPGFVDDDFERKVIEICSEKQNQTTNTGKFIITVSNDEVVQNSELLKYLLENDESISSFEFFHQQVVKLANAYSVGVDLTGADVKLSAEKLLDFYGEIQNIRSMWMNQNSVKSLINVVELVKKINTENSDSAENNPLIVPKPQTKSETDNMELIFGTPDIDMKATSISVSVYEFLRTEILKKMK